MRDITKTKVYRVGYYLVCTFAIILFAVFVSITDIGEGGFAALFKIFASLVVAILIAVLLKHINDVIASVLAVNVCMRSWMYKHLKLKTKSFKDCYMIYNKYKSYRICYIECKHAVSSLILDD